MEDINFKKFICYILNCIGATENNKITIFYVDNELKKLAYDGNNSKVQYDDLKHTYAVGVIADARDVTDGVALDVSAPYTSLNDNASNIKQYFNIKQVPSYITIKDNNKQLNVSLSIHQAFNLIKVFFDAKKWYLSQYDNTQNKMSYSSINFRNDNPMYGGFKIAYDKANNEVDDATSSYDKFLANVLRDFIYMVSGATDKINNFDVTTLYVLSKINYYLAKRYAVLSIKNDPKDFYNALKEYNQIAAYDNSFFNNFTYYNKPLDAKDYPRYYQKQILDLLNVGNSTTNDNDVLSYLLVTETNEQIDDVDNPITYNDFNKKFSYLEIYKSLFDKGFESSYYDIKNKFDPINSDMRDIAEYSYNFDYTKIRRKQIVVIKQKINDDITVHFNKHETQIKDILSNIITAIVTVINMIKDNTKDITDKGNVNEAINEAKTIVSNNGVGGIAESVDGIVPSVELKNATTIAAAGAGAILKYYSNAAWTIADFNNNAGTAANNIRDAVIAAATAAGFDEVNRNAIVNDITNVFIKNVIKDVDIGNIPITAANNVIVKVITSDPIIKSLVTDDKITDLTDDFEDIRTIMQNCAQYGIINKDKNEIITGINDAKCKISVDIKSKFNRLIGMINNYKSNHIAALFKAIKSYIKKYSKDTFSSVYQSPTISYSLTPMNIRPLIDKRATESDLSNYAAQIASDSFINSNRLPTIPDFKSIDKVIGLLGGAPDINNSSNVYRTIFNKILNALNAKRIKLNDSDREIVDKKLNDLEEIEQYLKSTLSDYAKYASVTHQKGTVVGNTEIRNFLNDYENKLREYNKKSASVVRFIGRLTPYLYSY